MGELVITLEDGTKQVWDNITQVGGFGWLSFADRTDIVAAVIGDGVTRIGYSGFTGCSSLAKVTLPMGLKEIRTEAFKGCSSLESVAIPAGVTYLGSLAFENCSSLRTLTIGVGVKTIETSAFKRCGSLRVLEIPKGVVTIESYAFQECTSLKSVTIGNVGFGKIQYIDEAAFYECTQLERFVSESYTTVFREGAVRDCPVLKSATIGEQCFIRIRKGANGREIRGGMYFDPFEVHYHYHAPAYLLGFLNCADSLEVKAKRPKEPTKEYAAVVKYRDWVSLLGNNRKSKLYKPLPGLSGPMLTTILDHQAAAERRSMFLHKTAGLRRHDDIGRDR